jgi:uncharacterized protein YodC (DUF2158 family)
VIEFEVGDVVHLKSGGPLMTAYRIEGEDVACVWFTRNTEGAEAPAYASFPRAILEPYVPAPMKPRVGG